MRQCELRGFPLPPSANGLYANQLKGGGGRYKTTDYKKFEADAYHWSLANQHQLRILRMMIEKLKPSQVLHVDRMFWFKAHKILTKDLRPRRNDTSNRLKALDDTLSKLIGLDDSYFWAGGYNKRPVLHESHTEGVDIRFTIIELEEIAKGQTFATTEEIFDGTCN